MNDKEKSKQTAAAVLIRLYNISVSIFTVIRFRYQHSSQHITSHCIAHQLHASLGYVLNIFNINLTSFTTIEDEMKQKEKKNYANFFLFQWIQWIWHHCVHMQYVYSVLYSNRYQLFMFHTTLQLCDMECSTK